MILSKRFILSVLMAIIGLNFSANAFAGDSDTKSELHKVVHSCELFCASIELEYRKLDVEQDKIQQNLLKFSALVSERPECMCAKRIWANALMLAKNWKKAELVFRKLRKQYPDEPEILLSLAAVYLHQNKLSWAIRTLQQGTASNVFSGNQQNWANWLLALASFQMDDCVSALSYLAVLPKTFAAQLIEYPYVKSYCLMNQGRYEQAMRTVESAPFKSDKLLKVHERSFLRSLNQRNQLNLALSLQSGYDSNALMEPDVQNIYASGVGSSFLAFDAGINGNHDVPFGGRLFDKWMILYGGSVRRMQYFDDDALQFSSMNFSGQLSSKYNFRANGNTSWVGLGYVGSVTTLDGGPLLESDSFYVFSESHAVYGRYGIKEYEFGETVLDVSFKSKFYHYGPRSGYYIDARLMQKIFLMSGKLKLYFAPRGFVYRTVGYKENIRTDAAYDHYGVGAFTGLSALLPWKIQGICSVSFRFHDYYSSNENSRWHTHRRDYITSANVSLLRAIPWGFALGAGVSLYSSVSSVHTFNYTKWLVFAMLQWRYSL